MYRPTIIPCACPSSCRGQAARPACGCQVSEQGLSSEEAKARLAHYGPNKLPESRQSPILKFLGYMWNPLSWCAVFSVACANVVFNLPSKPVRQRCCRQCHLNILHALLLFMSPRRATEEPATVSCFIWQAH